MGNDQGSSDRCSLALILWQAGSHFTHTKQQGTAKAALPIAESAAHAILENSYTADVK
jgi:hypothetical protein